MFSLTGQRNWLKPQFSVSSKGQGQHTEQKIWKKSHMDLPIPDSNLQLSSHKPNALPTELPGLPFFFHPCVNVYIYKPINRSEWRSYVPWVIKSKAKLIKNKKKVSTDRASMIENMNKVFCNHCAQFINIFWICLFHYMQFIFIENALS